MDEEEVPWPTLGPQVVRFIETFLVFGPGDLRGEPAKVSAEKRAWIYRMYEVYPEDHPQAGRRRFRRCAISVRKGLAKTELLAWIAACELHPEGPVRCRGWRSGQPIGVGVTDPYIPLVAVTEEQSDELAYGALMVILGEGKLAQDFDIGLQRIMRRRGDGKAVSLASAPDARDGARTTFEGFDETHRLTLPRHKHAHRTMLANLPKRREADAWALETTTSPAIGEGSVAEQTLEYAKAVESGKISDSRLFFFHRQASDEHQLDTVDDIRAAAVEASGADASWSDIDGIVEQFQDPSADREFLDRVWLNRPRAGAGRAFPLEHWDEWHVAGFTVPPDKALITLGFDGSRYQDATGLVGTEIETGLQFTVGLWERPLRLDGDWEVPEWEVDATVAEAFRRWRVLLMYCDPFFWESALARWVGQYGQKVVVEWRTNRLQQAGYMVRAYSTAMRAGEVLHGDDSGDLKRHLGNAVKQMTNFRDDQGERLYVISKERKDSPLKIDLAMAGALSWEARSDAIAAGALERKSSVYERRGPVTLG